MPVWRAIVSPIGVILVILQPLKTTVAEAVAAGGNRKRDIWNRMHLPSLGKNPLGNF